jgi:transcriptional regulator with XRE-family HTH domain
LHRTEIGLLERSARIPRVDTLIKISQGLDIQPAELVKGIEWIPAGQDFSPGEFTFQDLEDNPEQ